MMKRLFFRVAAASLVAAMSAGVNFAQDGSKSAEQKSTQQKPAAKPHKVWTEDDLGAVRRRSDVTVAAASTPAIPVSADAAASAKPASKDTQPASSVKSGKAALSSPKSVDEADGMIAWEQRDIDSQQEFVDNLQSQIDQAPADQRDRMQKTLQERQQILADTRREQQGLIAQRKTLQKKNSGDTSVSASTQP